MLSQSLLETMASDIFLAAGNRGSCDHPMPLLRALQTCLSVPADPIGTELPDELSTFSADQPIRDSRVRRHLHFDISGQNEVGADRL
jgi:hypothetical protein